MSEVKINSKELKALKSVARLAQAMVNDGSPQAMTDLARAVGYYEGVTK